MWKILVGLLVAVVFAVSGVARGEGGGTQPSERGLERAQKLRTDLKTFQLRLHFTGHEAKPHDDLRLSVTKALEKPRDEFDLMVQIPQEQATKIIDHLLAEGFFDRALDGNRNHGPVPPKEPYYTLMVMVDNNGDPVLYEEWLKLDATMIKRLDALRKVLADDAGKGMDTLLGRMADEAKEWRKQAMTSPATQKDGLSVTMRLAKDNFAADEPIKFELEFKNVSEKAFCLADADDYLGSWTIRFEDIAGRGTWEVQQTVQEALRKPTVKLLKSGESYVAPAELGSAPQFFQYERTGVNKAKEASLNQLKPGKYQLTAVVKLDEGADGKELSAGYWKGAIAAGPMNVEITEKARVP